MASVGSTGGAGPAETESKCKRRFEAHELEYDILQNCPFMAVSALLVRLLGGYKDGSAAHWENQDTVRSLQTLATIGRVYAGLPGATIATESGKIPLADVKWGYGLQATNDEDVNNKQLDDKVTSRRSGVQGSDPPDEISRQAESMSNAFEPLPLSKPATFACIAMLESGSVNIGPQGLEDVMAMSSGDSLYVAAELLQDPICKRDNRIVRVGGNIGRAGIVMMIPPFRKPQQRQSEDWTLVQHAQFDGQEKDSFEGTSLHLSFTNYSLTIDTGERGVRSSEVQLLETVISVHDKGRWVADIDVLAAFQSPLLRCLDAVRCWHKDTDLAQRGLLTHDKVSLDTWEEFLDQPNDDSVFRAHQNWQARLAATGLSVARGVLTIVCTADPCGICAEEERDRLTHKPRATYII